MKRLFLIMGAMLFSFSSVFAQESSSPIKVNAGLGAGLDYGGFGGRLSVSPISHVVVFGALGYNLVGLGYNAGAGFRILPDKSFCPYVLGMYGYNTAVIVLEEDGFNLNSPYNKAFYGPSVGLGFEKRTSEKSGNYLNLEVLYPFRSQSFKNYKTQLENNLGAKFFSIPIDISIGYHIGF